MTGVSGGRQGSGGPRPPAVLMAVLMAVLSVFIVVAGVTAGASSAAAASTLDVVAVLTPRSGATDVVVDVQPAPTATLPADAATVTLGGSEVPATVRPLVPADAPIALVVDASASVGDALAQELSGAAALLLRLPSTTPVTVVADQSTPRVLVARDTPTNAINALAGLGTSGGRSTSAALDLAEQELLNRAPSSMIVLATGGAGPTGSARTRLDRQLGISRTALAVVADPAVTATWEPSATASGGTVVQAPADHLADAFDQLDDTMRRRYTVSFTPPPGAPGGTARLTIQAGGEQLAADVTLPGGATPAASPTVAASPAASAGRTPVATTTGSGSRPVVLLVVLLVVIAALVGLVTLIAFRLRASRRPSDPVPSLQDGAEAEVAQPGPAFSGESTPGVRVFDVSDPHHPTELIPPGSAARPPDRDGDEGLAETVGQEVPEQAEEPEEPEKPEHAEQADGAEEEAEEPEQAGEAAERAGAEPTAERAGAEQSPVQPAPAEPAPAEPAPAEPAPAEPAPAESAAAELAPAEPARAELAPAEPAPAELAPAVPAPAERSPSEHAGAQSPAERVAVVNDLPQAAYVGRHREAGVTEATVVEDDEYADN